MLQHTFITFFCLGGTLLFFFQRWYKQDDHLNIDGNPVWIIIFQLLLNLTFSFANHLLTNYKILHHLYDLSSLVVVECAVLFFLLCGQITIYFKCWWVHRSSGVIIASFQIITITIFFKAVQQFVYNNLINLKGTFKDCA